MLSNLTAKRRKPARGLLASHHTMNSQGKGQSIRGPKDDLDPEDEEEEQIDDDLAADMLNDNVSPAASLQLAEQLKGLPESADEPAGYVSAQLIGCPNTKICCSCDVSACHFALCCVLPSLLPCA